MATTPPPGAGATARTTPSTPSRLGTVPWPADVAERYTAAGYWEGRTLGAHLRAAAAAAPDAVAVVDGDVRLTHRELADRADGLALALHDLGLRTDDRIVVQLPNGWEFLVLLLACFRLGVLPVMALPAHRRHELTHLTAHAEARAIVVPDEVRGFDHQAMARAVAAGAPTVDAVLVVGDRVAPDCVDLRALARPAADPAAAAARLDATAPSSGDVALMLLSGGTTGLPKLITRTHDDYACYVRHSAAVCGFGPSTVYLGVLPFGHNFTLGGLLGVLRAGGRVVVAPSPAPERVFDLVQAEGVTTTGAVPAVASRWLDHRAAGAAHDLSSLELVLVGGARLPDELARRVRPVLDATVQQGYGMAEGLVNLTRVDDPEDITCHTQGRPICDADELLVVDADGAPVPTGGTGELLTRGPYTPRGYYRAEEHNARAFTGDGWFRTGDVVRLRPDGYLMVEGREKDMINRGGEKISAEEVENFAYQVASVRAAAAVSMPHPELGETVCLYVVAHPGSAVGLADVVGVMEEAGVARFKLPERLVVVDGMPLTGVGKVDKKQLRADIARRLDAESSEVAAA